MRPAGRGRRRPARPGVHRRAHGRLRGAGGRPRRDRPGMRSSARSGLTRGEIETMRRGLREREAGDLLLRHGRHAAPPRHGERAADRQPAAAAREHRQAGRRHLPAARPLQRAGRPHRRHHRDPDRGVPGAARAGVRLRAAARARAQRGRGDGGDGGGHGPTPSSAWAATSPVAMSDPEVCFPAMRKLDLAVQIATKLNRSHCC